MGTPEFAVPSLDALLIEKYNVVGVITAPDRPAGRGRKMSVSAVKKYCLENDLNLLQPEKLKGPVFLKTLKGLKANLFIVVAFRMLPEVVWSMPEYGTFNLHASLLPQYRGAAPINHAIIRGEKYTGATTFFINDKIDTGSIILQDKISIHKDETAGGLHDCLMLLGSKLVITTIKAIETNSFTLTDQPKVNEISNLKLAPKIFKGDCMINWHQNVDIVFNFIRGLSPYPAAYSNLAIANEESLQIKFYKVRPVLMQHNSKIGSIETNNRDQIAIWVRNGKILVDELQVSGKKRLKTIEFLNGFKFQSHYFFQ